MSNAKSNPGYVDSTYLDATSRLTRLMKDRSYEVLDIAPGCRVLDVGCGPATDTITLAHLVGPTGYVVGVDYDEDMIRTATQRAEEAGVQAWVRHEQARVPPLPAEAQTFDAVRSERVFQHVRDPVPLLADMVRVTKPGGWVVVVDADHSSASIDCADPALLDLEWRLRRCRSDMLLNGYAGRQLYRLFKAQGLHDVIVEMFPIAITQYAEGRSVLDTVEQHALTEGVITPEELYRWHAMLEEADKAGSFFRYGIALLVAGRRP